MVCLRRIHCSAKGASGSIWKEREARMRWRGWIFIYRLLMLFDALTGIDFEFNSEFAAALAVGTTRKQTVV
jgi:hypothetical protein